MNEQQLSDAAKDVFTRLRNDCPAIPNASYTIHYDTHMTGLAYATAWFYDTHPVIQDASYPGHDFEIAINPNVQWYNGPCSSLPPNTYDLQTTLLHEMIHGVGIISSIRADKSVLPTSYDLQLRDRENQQVVDSFFDGAFGQSLHVKHVDVFNPITFQSGSSFSHYTHDGVMSPGQHTSECVRHIDDDVKRMLYAVGYGCAPSETSFNALPIILGVVGAIILAVVIAACACSKEKKQDVPYSKLTNRQLRF